MRQPGKRTGVEEEGGGGGIIEEIVAAITSSSCSVYIFRLFNVLENTDRSDGSINSFSYLWFVTGTVTSTNVTSPTSNNVQKTPLHPSTPVPFSGKQKRSITQSPMLVNVLTVENTL
jgi:hypothetical protein